MLCLAYHASLHRHYLAAVRSDRLTGALPQRLQQPRALTEPQRTPSSHQAAELSHHPERESLTRISLSSSPSLLAAKRTKVLEPGKFDMKPATVT